MCQTDSDLCCCGLIVAKQALRQKKVYEQELESISGRKMTLTTQVSSSLIALFHHPLRRSLTLSRSSR